MINCAGAVTGYRRSSGPKILWMTSSEKFKSAAVVSVVVIIIMQLYSLALRHILGG